jgi:hypothetical protein
MTSHNINQPNFIKNRFFPSHFHSPDLLKFVVNINNNLFRVFGKKNTFDAPPDFLIGSTTSPKVKTTKG